MKRPSPAAFAAAVLLSCPVAAMAPPELRGVVCAGDPCRPLPGLLVALYGADDLLVDSTYTRNDGGFRLRTPPAKGRSYVVVTRAESAIRKDLDFDPAVGRSLNLEVQFAGERGGLWGAVHWVFDKLGAELLLLIGGLVGFFWRQTVEDRLAAWINWKKFVNGDLCREIEGALTKFPDGEPFQKAHEMNQVVLAVQSLADFLKRSGMGGAKSRDLRDKIAKILENLKNSAGEAAGPQARAICSAQETLREIRANLPR